MNLGLVAAGAAALWAVLRGQSTTTPPARDSVVTVPVVRRGAPRTAQVNPAPMQTAPISPTDGAMMVIGAASKLGEAITGDKLGGFGAVVGLGATVLNPAAAVQGFGIVGAQAGNVGRMAGKDIDRLLGGDGVTGVGAVWQVSGYVTGLALAVYGLSAVPFVGQAVLLAVGVGALIDDAVRLGYGQNGVRAELIADALKRRDALNSRFGAMLEAASPGASMDEEYLTAVRQRAGLAAVGYLDADQTLRRKSWMTRPRGIGQSEAQHEAWGLARGRLVEDQYSLTVDAGNALGVDGSNRGEWYRYGVRMAFIEGFLKCHGEAPGFGQTRRQHSEWWLARGGFSATRIESNGDAIIDGVRVDWQRSISTGKPVLTEAAT